jgi:hypothetical protein
MADDASMPRFCSSEFARREFGLSRSALWRAMALGLVRAQIERGSPPRYLVEDLKALAARRAEESPRRRA